MQRWLQRTPPPQDARSVFASPLSGESCLVSREHTHTHTRSHLTAADLSEELEFSTQADGVVVRDVSLEEWPD